ncbi:helix-turn-helix domain-containing protein [Sphingomonas sp. 37zxx]|uniref:helix-turn-helix domain-containing protein n=1 Tax=Sphingomonas sp. 37zxx TaxID=1550073 RepID=UPI0018CF440B|nr:helix-turn-helix transcriptional regulator [Sphingomonas sp. 37zxx]
MATQADRSRLTPRQHECLRHVYARRTSEEISAITGLAVGTIDTYIAEAVTVLGARNRRHAAELLQEKGGQTTTPEKPISENLGVAVTPPRSQATAEPDGPRQWVALLPVRQRGAIGNDLGPVARLVAIVGFAIALAAGFGMLAVGMRVISDLATGLR